MSTTDSSSSSDSEDESRRRKRKLPASVRGHPAYKAARLHVNVSKGFYSLDHDKILTAPWQWVLYVLISEAGLAVIIMGDRSEGLVTRNFREKIDEVFFSVSKGLRSSLVDSFIVVTMQALLLPAVVAPILEHAVQLQNVLVHQAEEAVSALQSRFGTLSTLQFCVQRDGTRPGPPVPARPQDQAGWPEVQVREGHKKEH